MIRYSTVVSIARPPHEVLAALLDPAFYSQWTEMVDTRFDGPGTPRVGTRGGFRFPTGPLQGDYRMEILGLEPDHQLDIRIDGARLRWMSRITLDPEGDGTRMTYAGDLVLLGWRRILEPVFAREVQAGEAKEAERFRDLLEENGAQAAAPATA